MKTILVVSYHFPPEESSCSEKNIRLVKLLLDKGYKVIVLTKPGYGQCLLQHCNLEIIRTRTAGIFHKQISSTTCSITPRNGNNPLKSKIKRWVSSSLIPDGTIDWLIPAKRTIKEHYEILKQCDAILSISSPYSAHLVSHYASKKLGVPYVMSYGDPWIYEAKRKRGKLRLFIEKYLEGKLLNDATKILLITQWNKNKYQEIYNLPSDKVYTFHIGYDKADVLNIESQKHSAFKILYGGSLDPVHRNPEPFLHAISSVNGVTADIYCNDNQHVADLINEFKIGDKVSLKSLIKSSEFNRLMYDYDALLLFGNKTPFQVPGKVFTYIAAGKTVIYIKNNDSNEDGTEEVLRKYGNTIVVKNNPEDIAKCLNSIDSISGNTQIRNSSDFEFHVTMASTVEAIEQTLDLWKLR